MVKAQKECQWGKEYSEGIGVSWQHQEERLLEQLGPKPLHKR
jgi:hypothetical protein